MTIRYTNSDIKRNNRLARCLVCGADIFYLWLPDATRLWWHGDSRLDNLHPAVSENMASEALKLSVGSNYCYPLAVKEIQRKRYKR